MARLPSKSWLLLLLLIGAVAVWYKCHGSSGSGGGVLETAVHGSSGSDGGGPESAVHKSQRSRKTAAQESAAKSPPNVIVFLVDDLGWNQVGYHAKPSGNDEVKTPHIDHYATTGIELDRGSMTPWCGPSRAALVTGRTNVYNGNISTLISAYDDDIGYVAGLPPGTKTIAHALKEYGQSVGFPYTTWFTGKWGIGGTAFANTPLGMGFDEFRGFWGTGLENCDALAPPIGTVSTYFARPFDNEFGPNLIHALPGYFEQGPHLNDTDWCPYIQSIPDETLSPEEKFIACKTRPRKLPKMLDLDLLDKVVEQIKGHDYTKGPILQHFSTSLIHQPIVYPKQYDINASASLPEYFQPDQEKPPATNDDYRMSINQALRYLDDIFGSTMQAVKDAGQWNNTIVYFTTDNGGPIYVAAANNNYPLRGSKFSPFEGATRVVQFMTGGWLDNNLPSTRKFKSDTHIYPSDIAPTLLEMAGADVNLLLEGRKGATYGNSVWKFIQNSLDPAKETEPKQLVRKVSYNKDFFFDVQANRTMKHYFTGSAAIPIPRLWEPVWPKNEDLLMDNNYVSINPCRPDGRDKPSDCCLLDITNDFQEKNPLRADCDALSLEAKNLFEIEGGCVKNADGRYDNTLCLEPGSIDDGTPPAKLSLWSQMGAAGPFTNKKGTPLDGLPMKCVCQSKNDLVGNGKIDYFSMNVFGTTECTRKGLLGRKPAQSIACDGTMALPMDAPKLPTTSGLFTTLASVGLDKEKLELITFLERKQLIFLALPALYKNFYRFLTRKGFTEWPNVLKWPFFANDSCPEKGATSLAYPPTTFPPYVLGGLTEFTFPQKARRMGLCALYSDDRFFCPAKQNVHLKKVVKWNYERFIARGTFADGKIWRSYGLVECRRKCKATPDGTPYIGEGPHGLLH